MHVPFLRLRCGTCLDPLTPIEFETTMVVDRTSSVAAPFHLRANETYLGCRLGGGHSREPRVFGDSNLAARAPIPGMK